MFSEKTKVLKARRGSPEKKSVSPRYIKSATFPTSIKGYIRFPGIAEGRLQPLVRYRQGQVRTSHRGLVLQSVRSSSMIVYDNMHTSAASRAADTHGRNKDKAMKSISRLPTKVM